MGLPHTPYDGSKTPFSIGLAPVRAADWIEADARLDRDLAYKDELIASRREVVFRDAPDTHLAQREVLDLLVEHLLSRFSDRYHRAGRGIAAGAADRVVPLNDDTPPLLTAGRLVQEDLVLMRKVAGAYRLVAASLCFPSSWSLAEKFNQPMGAIHAKVPGYAGRMGEVVDRIFDNLRPEQILGRLNWSIFDDADLHHPRPKQLEPQIAGAGASSIFIRVERQTLRRLPQSGDVLFTIRIHHDPLRAIADDPRRVELAGGLRAQLLALDTAQLAYKGLTAHRDAIAGMLAGIAAAPR